MTNYLKSFLGKISTPTPKHLIPKKNNEKMFEKFKKFQVVGPRLMEDRKPFKLREVLIVYNFLQVVFSTWLFYEACMAGWFTGYSFTCQPVDYSRTPAAMRVCAVYIYSKIKFKTKKNN